jgi:hypothetical protein
MPEAHTNVNTPIETVRVREAVCIVHGREQLEKLIERLMTSGFDRSAINLMASQDAIFRKLGTVYLDPAAAADVPGVPRRKLILPSDQVGLTALVFGTLLSIGTIGAILPILASGGALAAVIVAGVTGGAAGGGLAKVIEDHIVGRSDQVELDNELKRDGLVIFVRVRDFGREAVALAIMRDCAADKVHVHDVEIPKTLDDIPLANMVPDPLLGPEKLGG